MSTRDKLLSCVLGLLVLATIGTIAYVTTSPPPGERFTEFYVKGVEGKAEAYPTELVAGEEGRVIIGIVNHEYEKVSYQVVVRINRMRSGEIGPIVLEHGEKQELSFILAKTKEKQEVEFLLFREGEDEPYRSLGPFPPNVEKKE